MTPVFTVSELRNLSEQELSVIPVALAIGLYGSDQSPLESAREDVGIQLNVIGMEAHNEENAEVDADMDDTEIAQAVEIDAAQLASERACAHRSIALVILASLFCVGGMVAVIISTRNNKEANPDYQVLSFEQFRDTRLPIDSLQRSTDDPDSPQARALLWLEGSLHGSSLVSWRLIQRYALAVVHFALHGEGWINSTGWLIDPNECSWWSGLDDRPCDVNDRFVSFSGHHNNMTGYLPPEIGLLTLLERIDLSDNEISGHLPVALGSLTRLEVLYFGDNIIGGTIPTEIGCLQRLNGVDLSSNEITGRIPTEIGSMTELEHFLFSKNSLTGSIPPQVGRLHKVVSMTLDGNLLNGTIPISLANMSSVKLLAFESNQLSGTLPTEIGLLRNLVYLAVSTNPLIRGPIPSHFGNIPALDTLYLDGTQISGTIPSQL
jgi:hypothetical protein